MWKASSILRRTGRYRLDTAREGTVGEARGEPVAGGDLRGGTDERAVGSENERVAAVENGEGRKGIEPRIECAEARSWKIR